MNVVLVARLQDGWECELEDGGLRISLQLADPGGALTVTGLSVHSSAEGGLAASTLSRAPYARWIQAAKDAVASEARRSPLVRVNDLLLKPFLEDRRGGAPRTDTDFAQLAAVYVAAGASRHGLARELAARYGGSRQTWRNRLTEAKRFTRTEESFDEDGNLEQIAVLSDEAMRLIYGDDYRAAFTMDAARDRELSAAMRLIRRHESPASPAERDAAQFEVRRNGAAEMARRLAAAHRVVATYGQSRK